MRLIFVSILDALLLLGMPSFAWASPCSGVDRHLGNERKTVLAPVIAKQLEASDVDVLQSFKLGSWHIIYVDTHESDEAFLFYASDPLTSRYITLWSGAASKTEERAIKDWVTKNVPGIPAKLATCFAWHVSKNRDM